MTDEPIPHVVPRDGIPRGGIGSTQWTGLFKMIEECGELLQVAGKLAAYPAAEHPDGSDLVKRIGDECADAYAAIQFFVNFNTAIDRASFAHRVQQKLLRFIRWHSDGRNFQA